MRTVGFHLHTSSDITTNPMSLVTPVAADATSHTPGGCDAMSGMMGATEVEVPHGMWRRACDLRVGDQVVVNGNGIASVECIYASKTPPGHRYSITWVMGIGLTTGHRYKLTCDGSTLRATGSSIWYCAPIVLYRFIVRGCITLRREPTGELLETIYVECS